MAQVFEYVIYAAMALSVSTPLILIALCIWGVWSDSRDLEGY